MTVAENCRVKPTESVSGEDSLMSVEEQKRYFAQQKQPQLEWERELYEIPLFVAYPGHYEPSTQLYAFIGKLLKKEYERGREEMTVNGKANYAAGRNDTLNEVEKIVDEAKTIHGSTEEVLSWLVGRLKANRDI